jgi:hypothetical protein
METIAGQSPFMMIVHGAVKRGRVERMMGPGDVYRLKAADLLAQAEQYGPIGEEFKALAMAFLRLAEEADRNAHSVLPMDVKRSWHPLSKGGATSKAGATATAAATDSGTNGLNCAANARSRAAEASDPARKAGYLRLERNWIRFARSNELAQRLTSTWHKPESANIIVWHHRILEAYYSPKFDEKRSEFRTVSLARHGAYEVRLMELSRKPQIETERLWLELFDHDHQHSIDSYGGRTLVDITAAAESLCSNAKDLNKSTD